MSENKGRPRNPFEGFRIEIDSEHVEEATRQLRDRILAWRERLESSFAHGRYTKVRLSYNGKPIMPDIPLGVFVATEGVAFVFLTPLSALLVNLGAKAVLDVEFVHEADELVREGVSLYLDGETEAAEAAYRKALSRRSDDPAALYNLAVLLRVTGRQAESLDALRKAAMGPEGHPDVVRAAEALSRLEGKRHL